MTNEFKKEIEILGAWDKTDPNPVKNCGIHSVEMRFYLKGEKGVIQFVLYTNWFLPKNRDRGIVESNQYPFKYWRKPQPADIGYHSPTPMYEGQNSMGPCHILGKPCYYDGSSLCAEQYFEYLVEGGLDLLWSKMEEYYQEVFLND